MAAARVVIWGVGVSAVGAALRALLHRIRRLDSRSKYDGLDGVVSFSARLIAAARAIETLRCDALVVDPLAALLAGPKAMVTHQAMPEADKTVKLPAAITAQAKAPNTTADGPASRSTTTTTKSVPAHNKQQQQQHQTGTTATQTDNNTQQQQQKQLQEPQVEPAAAEEQQQQQQQQRKVPRLIMRTCFFDDALLMALGQSVPRAEAVLAPVHTHIQKHQLNSCHQVVMLGAGMDTRPWRLPCGQSVKWFELDRSDVLAAKQTTLKNAGASFAGATTNSTSTSTSSIEYPLQVGCWSCASADLQQPGWVKKLLAAGLDATQPIVWVAEGLLYYLEPDTVGPMLQEAASMSAPGSMIVTNFMTEEGIKMVHAALAARAKKPAADKPTGSSSSSSNTTPPAAGADSVIANGDNTGAPSQGSAAGSGGSSSSNGNGNASSTQAGSGGGSAAAAANGQAAAAKAPPQQDLRSIGLLSHFKWGCPGNVEEFFAGCGWQLLVRYSWTQAADKYGWQPLLSPGGKDRPHNQEVQFVVGVVP